MSDFKTQFDTEYAKTMTELMDELAIARMLIRELGDRLAKLEKENGVPVGVGGRLTTTSEQEPVAYLTKRKIGGTEGLLRADMVDRSAKNQETHDFIPLYTTPPQRTWVDLTKEECFELCVKHKDDPFSLLVAVQEKLWGKNT